MACFQARSSSSAPRCAAGGGTDSDSEAQGDHDPIIRVSLSACRTVTLLASVPVTV